MKQFILVCCWLLLLPAVMFAQQLSGVVIDGETGEKVFSASVVIEGTTVGATTDFDGRFSFEPDRDPPFDLVVSYLGYQTDTIRIASEEDMKGQMQIKLKPTSINIGVVDVKEMRITEKQKESPLTVESMGLEAIKETPSASFYSGLGNLKGVDLTTASMGFVVINTRGFNSTSPVRSLQLIDGADNQAPGLNFSLGNFVGASELDIQKVDLIVGASSAFYGPNAFNGVINMQTKNPFYHQGLSALVKGGERGLFEGAFRYARAFDLGYDYDKLAFKVNFYYLRANDWEADNLNPVTDSESPRDNWGGYDAVNVYGDEQFFDFSNSWLTQPGLGVVHRTGYLEGNLVDYDTRNLKFNTALHYRLTEKIEASASYNFGMGTTVYQGDNRYSLQGLKFHQVKAEVKQRDKFFVRGYYTRENAGDSYDAVFTAFLLQDAAKSDNRWIQDYTTYWQSNIVNRVYNLPGYPDPNNPQYTELWFGDTRDSIINVAEGVLNTFSDSLVQWHSQARGFADSEGNPGFGSEEYFEPGTPRFDSMFNQITSKATLAEGGTRFYDRSALAHVQGEYKFTPSWLDITLGGNFRMYMPESNGTIFSDTSGRTIRNWEFGVYTGAQRKLYDDRIILSATLRMDKNENFDLLFSPAASVVYRPDENNNFRLSFSSAIRNPTLQDQYLFYNVGRAILIGNLNGFDNLVTIDSYFDSFEGLAFDRTKLDSFSVDPIRPEQVKTIELGYKATLWDRFYVDMSYYYNWYRDFIGFQLGIETDIDSVANFPTNTQVYRVSANASERVTTQGFSIGYNLFFGKYYSFNGNYSWNRLEQGSDDPIIPAFNTPEHKFNVGISGRDIEIKFKNRTLKYLGFNINYKWIQGFTFEGSPQFTGDIPTYDLLDAQINYRVEKIHTTFKLGGTNLLDQESFQTYGGPFIGRMVYFSVLFEMDKI